MMSFAEYKERLEEEGQRGNAVGWLWNYLAEYLLGFRRRRGDDTPANCMLPVDELLALKPATIKSLPGVGPAMVTVYGALYRSLRANPSDLRDRSLDLSSEGLGFFARPGISKTRIGQVWGILARGCRTSTPTVEQVEAFCRQAKDPKNWPRGLSDDGLKLLEKWVRHLKQGR